MAMTRFITLFATLIVLAATAVSAMAADFRAEEDTLSITDQEAPKDLHAVAGTVSVDTNVLGDLVIAGGSTLINSDVEDSLFVAGGTVTVRGTVGRHARVTGGTITISGNIKGDLFVAGGTVIVARSATIAGDLFMAGGDIVLEGTVQGRSAIAAGSAKLAGNFGNVKLIADEIHVLSSTRITGDFLYTSPEPAAIDSSAVITGQTEFTERKVGAGNLVGILTLSFLLKVVGLILAGWLLWKLFPQTLQKSYENAFANPLPTLGIGLAGLFLVPIVTIALFFTVIGSWIAGLLLVQWLLLLMLGSIVGKLAFGVWIYRLAAKEKAIRLDIATIVVGVLILSLVLFIPVIGPLTTFVFFVFGLGTVINQGLRFKDKHLSQA